jgi:hypothetical protein
VGYIRVAEKIKERTQEPPRCTNFNAIGTSGAGSTVEHPKELVGSIDQVDLHAEHRIAFRDLDAQLALSGLQFSGFPSALRLEVGTIEPMLFVNGVSQNHIGITDLIGTTYEIHLSGKGLGSVRGLERITNEDDENFPPDLGGQAVDKISYAGGFRRAVLVDENQAIPTLLHANRLLFPGAQTLDFISLPAKHDLNRLGLLRLGKLYESSTGA